MKMTKEEALDKIDELRKYVANKEYEKDWRDAFIEKYPEIEKVLESCAEGINVERAGNCTRLRSLMAYVLTFEEGGFWKEKDKLTFVTRGIDSDKKATYNGAKKFIEEF